MTKFVGTSYVAIRQGYYWPIMKENARKYARNFDPCQRFTYIPRKSPEKLTSIVSPWPFAQWIVDLFKSLPIGQGQAKYAIIVVDYFTKWVETEPFHYI